MQGGLATSGGRRVLAAVALTAHGRTGSLLALLAVQLEVEVGARVEARL